MSKTQDTELSLKETSLRKSEKFILDMIIEKMQELGEVKG